MSRARPSMALRQLLGLLPLALFAFATAAMAQPGAQALGRAEAEVVIPLRAVPRADLSFGAIVLGPAGEGAVEVAPDGSPPRYRNTAQSTCSGGADCAPHRASFDMLGAPDRSYRIALPGQIIAYGVRTGAGLPVINLVVRSLNAPAAKAGGQLDKAGRDSFYIGGTLQVPIGTRPDVFRAELPVIVNYN